MSISLSRLALSISTTFAFSSAFASSSALSSPLNTLCRNFLLLQYIRIKLNRFRFDLFIQGVLILEHVLARYGVLFCRFFDKEVGLPMC